MENDFHKVEENNSVCQTIESTQNLIWLLFDSVELMTSLWNRALSILCYVWWFTGGPSSLSLPEIHWMKQRDNEVVPLADVSSDAATASLSTNKTHKYL